VRSGEGVSSSPVGVGSGEGAVPPTQKTCKVFYVKECILVHLSQWNIGNFLASSVPFLRQKALF